MIPQSPRITIKIVKQKLQIRIKIYTHSHTIFARYQNHVNFHFKVFL